MKNIVVLPWQRRKRKNADLVKPGTARKSGMALYNQQRKGVRAGAEEGPEEKNRECFRGGPRP